MISEQEKQSFLNGAYGILSNGLKVKFIDEGHSSFVCVMKTSNTWVIRHLEKDSLTVIGSLGKVSLVGLWQDKSEPFDLERALKGNPVALRNGLKAEVFKALNEPDALGFQYFGLSHQCNDDGIWYHDQKWNKNLQATRIPDDQEHNYDIVGMWKEPEPQLSSNSLQLPKPVTEPLPSYIEIYYLNIENCKYVINQIFYKDIEFIGKLLENRMLYRTKEEVIQVIEAITGKPYEDR